MTDSPAWVHTLLAALESAVQWEGTGQLEVHFDPHQQRLHVAPCVVEWVGGEHDGTHMFPAYTLCVARLAGAFDQLPEIGWQTRHDQLRLQGLVQGQSADLTVSKEPLAGRQSQVTWAYEAGKLRRMRS